MKTLTRVAIALAGLALLGATGLVGFERSVDARARRLAASGVLPELPCALPPAAQRVQDEFERLTVELEQAIGSWGQRTPCCTPRYWEAERADELERQVAAAESVLAGLDALLASPETREVLETDARVLWTAHGKYPVALGSLGRIRHWTNTLNSQAVVRAREGDPRGAAASLASALRLLELADDDTICAFLIGSSMRMSVESCIERILVEEAPSAADVLCAALEPRLGDAPTSGTIARCYATDVAYFMQQVDAALGDAPVT